MAAMPHREKKEKTTFIRNHSQRQNSEQRLEEDTHCLKSNIAHQAWAVASSCLLLRLIRTVEPDTVILIVEIIAVTKQVSTMQEQNASPVKNVFTSRAQMSRSRACHFSRFSILKCFYFVS